MDTIVDTTTDTSSASPTEDCFSDVLPEDDQLVAFRIAVYVFIVGFLCLIGFVGNAISITVLRKDVDKMNTTFWLLQALAVADTSYLCASVFIYTLQTITYATDWWPALETTWPYLHPWVWPCASIAQTTTVWIILLITVHRYIAVSRPLTARTMNPRNTKIATILVYVVAVLYNITAFFERKTVVCEDGQLYVTRTSLGKNQHYFLIYHIILHMIFKSVGPLLVLIILTIGLIRELKKARQAQVSLTRNGAEQQHHNITFMLVAVVTVFLVCEIPDTVARIIYILQKYALQDIISAEFMIYVNIVIHALLVLNSAINFLIYGFTGTQFRSDLKKMFCKKGEPTSTATVTSEVPV